MKRKLGLLMLIGLLLLSTATAWADGDFYVIAGGGGVGTKITSLPYTINSAGFYYVTGNLTCASGNGIVVNADNVTIDIMGFTLTGPNQSNIDGVVVSGRNNVEVRNGTFTGWAYAMHDQVGGSSNCRAINIRAIGCGIALGDSGNVGQLVSGCTVSNAPIYGIICAGRISGNVVTGCQYGIASSSLGTPNSTTTITGNVAINCSFVGISSVNGSVTDNTVFCNNGQIGIWVNGTDINQPILLDRNTVNGAGNHFGSNGLNYIKGTNAGF
jgi:hypothetical protein